MEDIDVCRSSNTHNNMICLSCHGPNDLTLGYVSRDSSLIIGQLERIKLFYLYKCNRIENAIINTFSPIVVVQVRYYVESSKNINFVVPSTQVILYGKHYLIQKIKLRKGNKITLSIKFLVQTVMQYT